MPALAILLLLVFACPVCAGVVSRNLFEPGDGLLTYDDVNHREWLDFSATSGLSVAALETKLSLDGELEGFILAGFEEIAELADSLGIPVVDSFVVSTSGQLGGFNLFDLLGRTDIARGNTIGDTHFTGGIVADDSDTMTTAYFYQPLIRSIPGALNRPAPDYWWAGLTLVEGELPFNESIYNPFFTSYEHTPVAYWLYRDVAPIPEPTAAALAITACLAALRLRVFA